MIINGTIEISLTLSECMSIDLMRDNSVKTGHGPLQQAISFTYFGIIIIVIKFVIYSIFNAQESLTRSQPGYFRHWKREIDWQLSCSLCFIRKNIAQLTTCLVIILIK